MLDWVRRVWQCNIDGDAPLRVPSPHNPALDSGLNLVQISGHSSLGDPTFGEDVLGAALVHGQVDDVGNLIVRIPVIPGFNATRENISATAGFLTQFERLRYVELLPYHDLGVDKFTSLGSDNIQAIFGTPSQENLLELTQCFIDQGITVNVD